MTVMKIKKIGDPVLRTEAKEVDEITEKTEDLINNMIDTLRDREGLGLAANQVGILQQIAVIENENEIITLINPEIVEEEGSRLREEGCLSVPERQGPVPRAEKIRVRFQDREGQSKEKSFSDLTARIIQHEIDHLQGILFVDRVIDAPIADISKFEKES